MLLTIQAPARQLRELQERGTGVQQQLDALPGKMNRHVHDLMADERLMCVELDGCCHNSSSSSLAASRHQH